MRKSNRVSSLRRGLGILTLAVMATPAVSLAQSWAWTGAVNNNFSDAGNWTPATVPVSQNDTTLTFAGATSITVNNDFAGPFTLTLAEFNGTGGAITVDNGTLNFDENSGTNTPVGGIVQSGSAPVTINSAVTFTGILSLEGAGTGAVALNGGVSSGLATSRVVKSDAFTASISGTLSVGGFTVSGGQLTLDGTSFATINPSTTTYSGVVGTDTNAATAVLDISNFANVNFGGAGLVLGRNGANATLNVTDSLVIGTSVDSGIEAGGTTTININSGGILRTAGVDLALGTGTVAIVNVASGGQLTPQTFFATSGGTNSASTVNVPAGAEIGVTGAYLGSYAPGSTTAINVNGGRFATTGVFIPSGGDFTNTTHGTTVITLTNGATLSTGQMRLSDGSGGTTTLNATGSTIVVTDFWTNRGSNGTTVVNLTDSSFTTNADINLGISFVGGASSSTFTATNSVINVTAPGRWFAIGSDNPDTVSNPTAVVTLIGGQLNVNQLIVGWDNGFRSTFTATGTTITQPVAGSWRFSDFGTNVHSSATFKDVGTVVHNGNWLFNRALNSQSTVVIDNSVFLPNVGVTSQAQFNERGGGTATINLQNGGVLQIAGALNGNGTFLHIGTNVAQGGGSTTNINVLDANSAFISGGSIISGPAGGRTNVGSTSNITVVSGLFQGGSITLGQSQSVSANINISAGGRMIGQRALSTNGTIFATGDVILGGNSLAGSPTSNTNVTVTGTGSRIEATNGVTVGASSAGVSRQGIAILNGGLLRSSAITLGTNISAGSIVFAGTSNNFADLVVSGANSLVWADGVLNAGGSAGSGTFTGTVSAGGALRAGQLGVGAGTAGSVANLVMNTGGSATVSGSGTSFPIVAIGRSGTLTMTGGTVTAGGLGRWGTNTTEGSIVLNSGSILLNGRLGSTSTFSSSSGAVISGSGGSITVNDPTNFLYQEFGGVGSTYSGPVNVLKGTLGVTGTNAIGGTGTLTLGSPASLTTDNYELALRAGSSLSRTVVANGPAAQSAVISSTGGFAQTNAQTSTLSGPVVLNQNLLIAPVSTLNIVGGISGSGNVSVTGYGASTNFAAGTAVLGGALTYSGQTRVLQNTLRAISTLPTNNQLVVSSGASALLDAPASPTLNVLVSDLGLVSVAGTGSVTVPATDLTVNKARVVVIQSLDLAPTARIDLTNNDAIFRNGDINFLRSLVAQGVAGSTGIDSSLSSVMGGSGVGRDGFATIGLRSPASGFGFLDFSSFAGIAVSATDVVAKYTYLGDTDLNGTLDARDYNKILNGWTNGLSGWQNGDVNYDGVINGTDFTLFLGAYTFVQGGGLPFSDPTNPGGAIPEPAALGLIAAALPLVSRRRRRA